MIYKGRPRKTRIVRFNLLKPYHEEQTGDAIGRNQRPTPFRLQDFFNKIPDNQQIDQVEDDDDDGEVLRNTENTLDERQQRRRNIAATQVRLRDARSNEPSVPIVQAEQDSNPSNVVEMVDMTADTNTGQWRNLRGSNQSNEETPMTITNHKERDAEEQPVIRANEPPEVLD